MTKSRSTPSGRGKWWHRIKVVVLGGPLYLIVVPCFLFFDMVPVVANWWENEVCGGLKALKDEWKGGWQ